MQATSLTLTNVMTLQHKVKTNIYVFSASPCKL